MTNLSIINPPLRQRGRASVQLLTQMARATGALRQTQEADIAAAVPDPQALPDDLDKRMEVMAELLADSDANAALGLIGDWHGRMHGRIAIEAFEEAQDDIADAIAAAEQGPATLELDPDLEIPDYFDGYQIHRTHGAWDGHPFMGMIHGEIVHRKIVEALYPGGIFKTRRAVAGMAPKDHYDRILDMGASSGHFTAGLQDAYPDAEIVGIDLSPRMLEHAWRMANENGWAWKLYQRDAQATGFEDDSFDLVASFIMLHEMPADVIRKTFAEAFRVCKPGGDMIMSDVTRYADMDKLGVWKADRLAKFGGEPWWRESASLDLAEVAREAGFVDVKAEGIYPHVVQGRKP